MPCYDSRDQEDRAEMRRRNDELTALLCAAGKAFANGEWPPAELLEWWSKHAEDDERRGEPWLRSRP